MARKSQLNHFTRLVAAALVAAACVTAAKAQAAACAPRTEIVEWLQKNFTERPVGFGVIGNHALLEIHVSATGSWTVLTTDLAGRSCIVSAGHSWTPVGPPAGGASATDAAGPE